jgi:hypothetical protein
VLAWRFRPARRGGTPVAARIRARVDFHQEQPTATASTVSAAARAASSPAPGSLVQGTAAAPESERRRSLRDDGKSGADAPGDHVRECRVPSGPFRDRAAGVVLWLAGFRTSPNRGAPPNDGYCVGGSVPVSRGNGGVIHPALIDHSTSHPGAAPAGWGFRRDHRGSDARAGQHTAPGSNLRVIDAGALLEAPLDDGRGSVLAAGRYGYPGPILSAITSSVKLDYWDYQTRATWRIADHDTLGIFALGSHDYLAEMEAGGEQTTGNGNMQSITTLQGYCLRLSRIDLRWDHVRERRWAHARGGDCRLRLAGQPRRTRRTTRRGPPADRGEALANRARSRCRRRYDYTASSRAPAQRENNPTSATRHRPTSRWARAVVWRLSPRVEIVPGFASTSSSQHGPRHQMPDARTPIVPTFDPRLSARVTLTGPVAWLRLSASRISTRLARRSDPPRESPSPGSRSASPRCGRSAQARGVRSPGGLPGDAHRVSVRLVGAYRLDRQLRQLSPPDGPRQCRTISPFTGGHTGSAPRRRPLRSA